MGRFLRPGVLGPVVLFALVLAPWGASEYQKNLLILTFLYAVFAMSLDLIHGYAGVESLGHAAFFGTGAYVAGLLSVRVGVHSLVAGVLAGAVAAGLAAALVGPAVLRTRGIVSLMAFLAVAMMLWGVAVKWRWLTGGDDGLTGIPRLADALPPILGAATVTEYYLLLAVCLVVLWVLRRVGASGFGLALQGIRDNEARMRTLGYNTQVHKLLALVGSGVVAGLAGALLAYHNGFVGPTELHVLTSAEGLVMVLVGGAGTFVGPALGAFVVTVVKHWVSAYTEYWAGLLGLGYILVVRYAPQGLYPLLAAAWNRRGPETPRSPLVVGRRRQAEESVP